MDCCTLPTWEIFEGQALPELGLVVPVDDGYLDGTGYTWAVACARTADLGADLFAGSSPSAVGGIGTDETPSVVVTWSTDNLGSLGRGDYVLQFTGTAGGLPFILQLPLRVRPGVG